MLKRLAFSLSGLLICLLVVVTLLEPFLGTEAVKDYFYTSPIIICLWGITASISVVYLFRQSVHKNLITFLLHFSFVVILAGSLVTHLFGKQGTVHLRIEQPQNEYVVDDGRSCFFEFSKNAKNQYIKLLDFQVEYYDGTLSPKDFASTIEVSNGEEVVQGQTAMNRVFSYKNYRFCQQSYDEDERGVTFSVNHDPYGIALTYCGYFLLFFSFVTFFFQKNTRFRQLYKR
ncbi:MAG: cytochrome c biogenesis protein ResB [Paludibacteraceae bacterium]|nr:cytochrome c biogenesis protein ResB [Paludibacteraceae bacterium]MBO7316270.1 cytochrome c biogenesis protein ResB [Paludibacteraceae bacterium]